MATIKLRASMKANFEEKIKSFEDYFHDKRIISLKNCQFNFQCFFKRLMTYQQEYSLAAIITFTKEFAQAPLKDEVEIMRVTPLGLCLRVIVNKKPQNHEKTKSSVLSVLLLIYGTTLCNKLSTVRCKLSSLYFELYALRCTLYIQGE